MHMAAVHAEEVELAADAALPVAEAGPALPVAQGSAVVDVPTRRERAAPIPVVLGQPVVAAVVGTIRSPRCPRRRSAIVFAAVAVAAAVVVAVAAVAAVDSSATEPPPGGSSDSPPPSPSFEVPDCPGLGPCFNERGDNTQVLFWLWVGFFAFFALCCCACIVTDSIQQNC